ncbi:MAG: hypothetical protein Q7T82_02045 [Armatimonadota bacterium]|nr:hypothetical protein [Armatimonadota bacterium]
MRYERHFVNVNKMVDIGSGAQRQIGDVALIAAATKRAAGLLIAQIRSFGSRASATLPKEPAKPTTNNPKELPGLSTVAV